MRKAEHFFIIGAVDHDQFPLALLKKLRFFQTAAGLLGGAFTAIVTASSLTTFTLLAPGFTTFLRRFVNKRFMK